MSSIMYCTEPRALGYQRVWTRACAAAVMSALAAAILSGSVAQAIVVTDDFSDGDDTANPTWTHLDGAVSTTGQTWTVADGKYHLRSPTSTTEGSPGITSGPYAGEIAGFDFVGSYAGPSFTDVRVSADFVDFPTLPPEQSPIGLPSWFGVAARWNGDNGPLSDTTGIQLHGYTYHWESSADGGLGEMVLGFLWAGGLKDIGSQKVTLDNTNDYRIVLEVLGNVLHGQVFNLGLSDMPLAEPVLVAEDFRDVLNEPVIDDHDLDGGAVTPEQPLEPLASGFSGVFGVGHVFFFEPDFTIDNFRTETAVPGDYNRNGATDAADYVLWRETFGQTSPDGNPPIAFGDMRANGAPSLAGDTQTIDQADYEVWAANFGSAVSGSGLGSSAAVPEPASAALLVLSAVGIWLCRRSAR